jgi:hypothetical protein
MKNINNNQINNNLLPIQTIKNSRFIEEVKLIVCAEYKIDKAKLIEKTNKREVVLPRQVAIYFCRKFLVYSTLDELSKHFKKHYTSIIHSVNQVDNLAKYDKQFKAKIDKLQPILFNVHNSIMLNNPTSKDEYFVDLNNCTSIKVGKNKAIVTTGLTKDEIAELLLRLGLTVKTVEHKNTGMYILLKNEQ